MYEAKVMYETKVAAETYEANVRAGLFTVQELAPQYFTAEELAIDTGSRKWLSRHHVTGWGLPSINAPKMCDLFTAEELEPLKNFTIMGGHVALRNLLKEGACREKERLGLELPPEYYILMEELNEVMKGPKQEDLFTAEELKEYGKPWSGLKQPGPDYTQWEADRKATWRAQWEADRDKLRLLHEEGARRDSVWREDRKAKALQLYEEGTRRMRSEKN